MHLRVSRDSQTKQSVLLWKQLTVDLWNVEVRCFLWGTNQMFKCYLDNLRASEIWWCVCRRISWLQCIPNVNFQVTNAEITTNIWKAVRVLWWTETEVSVGRSNLLLSVTMTLTKRNGLSGTVTEFSTGFWAPLKIEYFPQTRQWSTRVTSPMPVRGAICPTLTGVLCSYLVLFALKGALQELKLYGTPSLAEVQCDNAFQVSTYLESVLVRSV